MSFLFNGSGGWRYHLRAARQARGRWREYVAALANWQSSWRQGSERLLLLGPSAGYSICPTLLARYERVDVLEPDGFARWRLQQRFASTNFNLRFRDYFPRRVGCGLGPHLCPLDIRQLWSDYADHDLLFCNFLGQLPVLYPDACGSASYADYKRCVRELAAGEGPNWASYHDRVSVANDANPNWRPRKIGAMRSTRKATSELVEQWFGASFVGGSSPAARPGTRVVDHQTADMLAPAIGPSALYVQWPLYRGRWHLVECLRSGDLTPRVGRGG